jgi:divalent metal cation (Fe/Co/Zn/Cd) transporter
VEPNQHGETLTERVLAAALTVPGVREAHNVTVFELDGSTQVSLHLKLPPTLTLADGHAVAGRVEDAILTAVPQVTAVQTHLEPLDPEVRARPLAAELEERLASSVRPIATQIAGSEPRELRFVDSDLGIVGFVTLTLPADRSVAEAHLIASEIEQTIHDQIPEIRKLVVHTEP